MAHKQQIEFIKSFSQILGTENIDNILEIGSFDVNGIIRTLFKNGQRYTGIDLCEGPGVDKVISGHLYGIYNYYDLVISCEVFEHNPFWLETFVNMIRVTNEDGWVVFTCATTGRLEHGTARTNPTLSPGTSSIGWNYYKNLTKKEFMRRINLNLHFEEYKFYEIEKSSDLYFIGKKKADKKTEEIFSKMDAVVTKIKKIEEITIMKRIRHKPLKILSKFVSDKFYQEVAIPYERYSVKLSNILFGRNR
jgi:hypothetical protein